VGAYVHDLAHGLVQAGHRVIVLANTPSADRHFQDEGVEVYLVRTRFNLNLHQRRFVWRWSWVWSGRHLTVMLKLLRLVRDHKIDLIESPEMHSETLLFSLLRMGNMPLVIRLHIGAAVLHTRHNYEMNRSLRKAARLERMLLRRANAVSAPGAAVAEATREATGLPLSSLQLIPNPLDTNLFRPSVPGVMPKPVVLFVGRIDPVKGVAVLIETIPRILNRIAEAEFWVVAPAPPEGSSLDGWVEQIPEELRSRIKFLGFVPRERLPEVYTQARVVVFPSPWESFGYPCAEAMACGRPAVSFAGSGAEEIIGPSLFLLAPQNDVEAFVNKVAEILSLNEQSYNELSKRVRARILQQFSSEVVVPRVVEFYRNVLRQTATPNGQQNRAFAKVA
jgi:glycosyltransferase involved in cell wall biosynthesis